MALASPSASSRSILAVTDVNTAGTILYPFTVPQDAQSIIGKVYLNSTWNASGSALVYFQTSEDGGTTWRDMAVVSVGAATVAATMNNQNAQFFSVALAAGVNKGSTNWIGSVAASTLSAGTPAASAVGVTSGLPVMGVANRVQITYANTITTGGINVVVYAPTTDFTS
jgi:hypothetical protein